MFQWLTYLGREVLHDRGCVHRSGRTDALLGVHAGLQKAMDTADRELQAGTRGPRLRGTLRPAFATLARTTLATLAAFATLATFATTNVHVC